MKALRHLLPATAALVWSATTTSAAFAHSAQLHSYSAQKTTVAEGETIRFDLSFSFYVESDQINGGGAQPEPAPAPGAQQWLLNWHDFRFETLKYWEVQTNTYTNDAVSSTPGLPSGSGDSTSWSFYASFPVAGSYDISVTGMYRVQVASSTGAEYSTRDCAPDDPADAGSPLSCTPWAYSIHELNDSYEVTGGFGPSSIRIEVLAVPEPAGWLLMLGGLVGLAASGMRCRPLLQPLRR